MVCWWHRRLACAVRRLAGRNGSNGSSQWVPAFRNVARGSSGRRVADSQGWIPSSQIERELESGIIPTHQAAQAAEDGTFFAPAPARFGRRGDNTVGHAAEGKRLEPDTSRPAQDRHKERFAREQALARADERVEKSAALLRTVAEDGLHLVCRLLLDKNKR